MASMSLSLFLVLSPRGDSLISRDFRGDLPKSAAESFFRNVKFYQGKQQDAPPVFHLDGINFFWIRKNGLFFVFANKVNHSPSLVIELLTRITRTFKDYCGVLSEESLRANFVLLYELLDEMLDFGFVQGTSSDLLKSYVFNEPVVVQRKGAHGFKMPSKGGSKTTPSTSVDKPIAFRQQKGRKNEIYVDVYERIAMTFSASGYVLNSEVAGSIQMKSYLQGNPALRLALNEELVVGKGAAAGGGGYGVLELDDCNFHECVNLEEWDGQRILTLTPPDGEFVVMNYRISSDFRTPFRIFPFFELVSPYKVELIVKIRADIPEQNYGANVSVEFPVPKNTSAVSCDLGVGVTGQHAEYQAKDRKVVWRIKKFTGGTEQTLRSRITLTGAHTATVRKEIGPISLSFEVPMFNPSNMQVRYLRIAENKGYTPYRWVRYVTRSSSYVCRL